jgi:hypothetical protein
MLPNISLLKSQLGAVGAPYLFLSHWHITKQCSFEMSIRNRLFFFLNVLCICI